MTFRLPEIKFLRTGPSGLALKAPAGRKKVRSGVQDFLNQKTQPISIVLIGMKSRLAAESHAASRATLPSTKGYPKT
jgi:hypothetical protein